MIIYNVKTWDERVSDPMDKWVVIATADVMTTVTKNRIRILVHKSGI